MVVRDAIDVLFRTVGRLPLSAGTDELRARVEHCARLADEGASLSTDRDGLMKRVLALHVDVAKVERLALVASSPDLEGHAASPPVAAE
jgi:hypothetical protein